MFASLQEIFDKAEDLDKKNPGIINLVVEEFSFILSDRDPGELPSYSPSASTELLFEYVSTRRPYLPPGLISRFQNHSIGGKYTQLNGCLRLCRKIVVNLDDVRNGKLEPGLEGAKLGDVYFTFEFEDVFGVLKKVGINKPLNPILLPNAFLPGFEGDITRQTTPDVQFGGLSMGIGMKIKDVRAF
ncbi:MAG: hypothetical protein ING16_16230 [Roseomonas sp.]|jgi:hypothetical protein|nr:hypothetical protein [Roseomonas sp.]